MKKDLHIAFSPCPNDTFVFDAWVHNKIESPITPTPHLADIQQLNEWAFCHKYPVTKVSTFAFGKLSMSYTLLPTACAIGFESGPMLVAKKPFAPEDIVEKVIAVPGLDTTAYLLFRSLFPAPKKVIPCSYETILETIENGTADAGIIIHETRFLFEERGFFRISDLGRLFTKRFNCPIPLGVLIASKELPQETLLETTQAIRSSIEYARDSKTISGYVQDFSQEKDPTIIRQHIDTFVTSDTHTISDNGKKAIEILFKAAASARLLPKEAVTFSIFEEKDAPVHVCNPA